MRIKHHASRQFTAFAVVLSLVMVLSNEIIAQGNRAKEIKNSTISGLLSYKDKNGTGKTVHTLAQWGQKRRQILDSMQMAMGKLPGRSGLSALDIKVIDSLQRDSYTRLTISFTVAENERVHKLMN